MKKKTLSIILAFCMMFTVFSGMQIITYAEGNTINWTDGTVVTHWHYRK